MLYCEARTRKIHTFRYCQNAVFFLLLPYRNKLKTNRTMETKQLSSIPETMLITLWAKATETEEDNGLLHDEIARQIISNIDYDFTKFK